YEHLIVSEQYFGPEWLRRILPEEQLQMYVWPDWIRISLSSDNALENLQQVLPKLPQIRRLSIRTDDYRADRWPQLRSTFRRESDPKAFVHIEELKCDQETVDDDSLKLISHFENIRSLDLSRCDVSDAGVAFLGSLRSLESLDLSETGITDASL